MTYQRNLPRPFFVLAPMDDVTDTVFRQIIADCAAPDLYFTEFVNADGLQSAGRQKLLKKLRFSVNEQPLIAQIWGKEPENFRKTAEQLADGSFARELGLPEGVNFAGVDLNMGCPQKNEVKNGTCAALMNNRELAVQIIKATQEGLAGRLPLSVKTRLGYSSIDMTWIELLLTHNLSMLTIHGRTKTQMSKVPANWEAIEDVRKLRDRLSPDTLIIGNGDVQSRSHGRALAQRHGLDGIMIARGIFQDPFAFSENSPWSNYEPEARQELFKRHVMLFAETWKNRERPIQTLNKFCKIYINGYEGAKELREDLMKTSSTAEILDILSRSVPVQSS
jgi:tRNA-dihydrouridine synthase